MFYPAEMQKVTVGIHRRYAAPFLSALHEEGIIELTPKGIIDRRMRFDDYLASEDIRELRDKHYAGHHLLEI